MGTALLLMLSGLGVGVVLPRATNASALGGTLTIGRNERRVIDRDTTLTSPVVLQGDGELTIRDAHVTVIPLRGSPEAVIELRDQSRLVLERATLTPRREDPGNLIIHVRDASELAIADSVVLHRLDIQDNATFTIRDSRIDGRALAIPEEEGLYGLVRVSGHARGAIEGSVLNALELALSPTDSGTIQGLRPGRIRTWDSKTIGNVDMAVRIQDTDILPSTTGPFVRGWSLAVPPTADVRVKTATLGSFTFREIANTTLQIADLPLQRSTSLTIERLSLEDVTVHHQWGFDLTNATATITASDGVSLSPGGGGTVLLAQSMMNNFAPRGFRGTLVFDNAAWEGRGSLIGGNRFQMSGTVRVDPALKDSLTWNDTVVTRIYPTDDGNVTLTFTDENFRDTLREAPSGGHAPASFSFFDSTEQRGPRTRVNNAQKTWIVVLAIIAIVGVSVGAVSVLALRRKRPYT
jgi:hypothetical protein